MSFAFEQLCSNHPHILFTSKHGSKIHSKHFVITDVSEKFQACALNIMELKFNLRYCYT